MLLFKRDRSRAVRSFVLNLVNTNCLASQRPGQCDRLDSRVNLSVVVIVVPIEQGHLMPEEAIATVTKDFGSMGVSLVLSEPRSLEDVVLVFPRKSGTAYVRAKATHLSAMGAGFFQLGLRMTEVIVESDYPELKGITQRF